MRKNKKGIAHCRKLCYNTIGKRFPNILELRWMVTIKEIAQKAGVSPATVSRVLTNSRNVNPEIKKNVLRIADESGYSPNVAARSLVKKGTKAIGVVVTNLHDPFFHDLILGFEAGAVESDYNVVFCSTMGKNEQEKQSYLKYLSNGVVDGIILYGTYRFDEVFVRELHTSGFPLVLIENQVEGVKTNVFLIDNRQGQYNAVRYLHKFGHRRIAYIAGKQNKQVCTERLEGYHAAIRDLMLPDDAVYTRFLSHSSDDAGDIMEDFLQMPDDIRPTAVLCYDDAAAAQAIMRAMSQGFRVPEDVSVMGFDNQTIPPSGYVGPRITSVSQPLYEIGFDSIIQLARYISDQKKEQIIRTYSTTIAEKDSVTLCKKGVLSI